MSSTARICIPSLIAVFLLNACATVTPRIETTVTSFHQFSPASRSEIALLILPWRKELGESLEFRAYAKQVEDKLRLAGYSVVSEGKLASHALFLNYGIDDGRTVTSSYSIPQFGTTGYSGATTTGTVSTYGSTSFINANTTKTPIFGVTGYQTGTTDERVFSRFVSVDIVKLGASPDAATKVYEGRLKSQGSCGNLVSVMPTFLESMFMEFPGQNGKAVNRELNWSGSC